MKEFERVCKEFEAMDSETYYALLLEKSKVIIPALSVITVDGLEGLAIYASFILGAIVTDGRLSLEEYAISSPLFKAFFGEEVTYSDCEFIVRKMRSEEKELRRYVDDMVDVLGMLSNDLKDDIILVCLMICAIDGKVSSKEKKWIKQLIK